jgi:fluoroquinolone transport system permease protein
MVLFKSEFIRLIKYRIIPISFAISLLWMVALYFIGEEAAKNFASLFIALDASVMSLLMIGSSLFFEREENTLKPLLVTPTSIQTILLVKIISTIYIALQSAVLVSLFVYFILGISLNFVMMVIFVSLIATVHALIGFYLSMKSIDFTGFLVSMIVYTVSFGFPSLLLGLQIIPTWAEFIFVFSPIHVANLFMNYVFQIEGAIGLLSFTMILGITWLGIISLVLYKKYVVINYPVMAVKE